MVDAYTRDGLSITTVSFGDLFEFELRRIFVRDVPAEFFLP